MYAPAQALGYGACMTCQNCELCSSCTEGYRCKGEGLNPKYGDVFASCTSCFPGYYKASGVCLKCAGSTFQAFKTPLIALSVIAISTVIYYCMLCLKWIDKVNLNVANMIRAKVTIALLQMLALFGQQSSIFSRWFKKLTSLVSSLTVPFETNPACLEVTKQLESQSLGWATGWITFYSFWIFILVVLNIHKLPFVRRNYKPATFEALQKIASIMVSSAVIVIAPIFIDFEEVSGNIMKFAGEFPSYSSATISTVFSLYLTDVLLRCASGIIVVAFFYFYLGHASTRYELVLRDEVSSRDTPRHCRWSLSLFSRLTIRYFAPCPRFL